MLNFLKIPTLKEPLTRTQTIYSIFLIIIQISFYTVSLFSNIIILITLIVSFIGILIAIFILCIFYLFSNKLFSDIRINYKEKIFDLKTIILCIVYFFLSIPALFLIIFIAGYEDWPEYIYMIVLFMPFNPILALTALSARRHFYRRLANSVTMPAADPTQTAAVPEPDHRAPPPAA